MDIKRISLIVILPFIVFLVAIELSAFNSNFYHREFLTHNVYEDVRNADELHLKVMDFIEGKSSSLPDDFNEREKQHLRDVRSLAANAKHILLFLVVLSVFLLVLILKSEENKKSAIGKIMFYCGLFTILTAIILVFLLILSFGPAFDSFHRLFFRQGTYMFDPSTELIVNLYPEQLFMDLGILIMKWVLSISILITSAGLFLMKMKTKRINIQLKHNN